MEKRILKTLIPDDKGPEKYNIFYMLYSGHLTGFRFYSCYVITTPVFCVIICNQFPHI